MITFCRPSVCSSVNTNFPGVVGVGEDGDFPVFSIFCCCFFSLFVFDFNVCFYFYLFHYYFYIIIYLFSFFLLAFMFKAA